ncbi:MAG: hypothetical protein WCJ33_05070, partial [Pseudomonadota bacterium]
MIGICNLVSIYISKSYFKIRRKISKIPFIYSLYRSVSFFRSLESKLSSIIGYENKFIIENVKYIDNSEEMELKELLDKKLYQEFLDRIDVISEKNALFGRKILVGILNASAFLSSWKTFDKVFWIELKIMSFNAMRSDSSLIKHEYQEFFESLVLILIQNARLEDALRALYLIDLIDSKLRSQILIQLLNFIQAEELEVTRRGKEISSRNSNSEINQVASIVWGKRYIDDFMNYNVRSMLASGNMPSLKKHGLLIHSIVTTPEGKEYIQNHEVFKDLLQVAQVEFFCFPEKFLGLFKGEHGPDTWSYMLYGILDHINIFFARSLKANLFLIPVDSIVANPSFANMRRYIVEEGYDCCGGANLVAERDSFTNALKIQYHEKTAIEISTKDLSSLALKHPHNYITTQLVHDKNKNFGKHAREVFWLTEGGINVHSIYTHPLATSAKRICGDYILPFSWVDFLLPVRLFPNENEFAKYKIIDNAEEAYINNFAPASREYETTGRAFDPADFAAAHIYSYPIHRFM